jgi:N-acetylmuramoyl-L-alanine amidase
MGMWRLASSPWTKPLYARLVRSTGKPSLAGLVVVMLCLLASGAGCGKSAGVGTASHAGPQSLGSNMTTVVASIPTVSRPVPVAQPSPTSPARTPTAAIAPTAGASSPAPPPIVQSPIPFGAKRKAEMVGYALRHYNLRTYRLIEPHVIVIHYTETPDFQSTFNTFAPDVPDSELHELPNTCAHFVIDADGTVHQLVPLGIMCRHTVGLNWTAIGIEHVGYSDAEVLDRRRQMSASLRLVRWLRCRFHIPVANVIGHNESLSSPYHHENVPALRTQTHSDFNHADMQVYRARLRASGHC